jgi:two-component system, OmpR family, phosphate regulon sensor histidine kinase PhoR
MRSRIAGLDRQRLRLSLTLFFVALALPTALLIQRAYRQARWETVHQQQVLAEEFVTRLDAQLTQLILTEEARAFTDYTFLVVAGDPAANFVQRSPLSAFPVKADLPGLLGYFQIDAAGQLSSPLLPVDSVPVNQYGISAMEYTQRSELMKRLQDILLSNRLVSERRIAAPPSTEARNEPHPAAAKEAKRERSYQAASPVGADYANTQSAFDKLNAQVKRGSAGIAASPVGESVDTKEKIADQESEAPHPVLRKTLPAEQRSSRKEQNAIAVTQSTVAPSAERADMAKQSAMRVTTFESEIDPFDLSRLGSGHFVLFRKVWREGQRYIQGALIEQDRFVHDAIDQRFHETTLATASRLFVLHNGEQLSKSGSGNAANAAADPNDMLLYRGRLSAPMSDLELLFTTQDPAIAGPGTTLITWLAGLLATILCSGTYLLYRLGARQIALLAQQQDFISAVSHELKTPLTSIRMYGEMLREGWVQEDKKADYYAFIHSEAERLSRLINNVLQLARMTRHELKLECKPVKLAELMDMLRSKISSQVAQAGFELDWRCAEPEQSISAMVDADALAQIMINLVDNAIKFSSKAEVKKIDVQCRLAGTDAVLFSVRDFGPGLPKDQMKKIFRLFYRLENELTRETVGTGIGLALVQQLVLAMQGRIDVVNAAPGAEFSVRLPVA